MLSFIMEKALLLLGFIVLSSCASMPQNVDDFRKLAEESSLAKKTEFTIKNAKLTDVKTRMQKMAQQCYAVTTQNTSYTTQGGISHWDAEYNPAIQENPGMVSMALQRKCKRGCGYRIGGDEPAKGDWMFLVDIVPGEKGTLNGIMYSIWGSGLSFGDMVEDTVQWLQNNKKLCPEIK